MSQGSILGGCYRCCAIVSARRSFGAVSASASSPSAVDQMIDYAVAQRKANPDMAIDVLMSGLSYTNSQADPIGSSRLHLAIAQLEADRNSWGKAQDKASSSLRLAAGCTSGFGTMAADLTLDAGSLATRALLIMGHDGEAQSLAEECELALRAAGSSALADTQQTPSRSPTSPRSIAHTRSLAMLAIATHTNASTAGGAAVDALATALGRDPEAAARTDLNLADAAHGLGLLQALQGRWDAAAAPLSAAAAAATAAAAADEAVAVAALPAAWMRQQHHREVAADALTGRAQLLMRAREWCVAEELMGEALKMMEAVYGERSPSLAPLLMLLGYSYSRSARVTFAEGLYREAAKLLRLDPARVHQQRQDRQQRQQQELLEEHPHHHPQLQLTNEQRHAQQSRSFLLQVSADAGVHASSVAVLAWRYAQLLWVLPNRGGEASVWERCAREFWAASRGLGEREIESVLGGEGHLKGEGPEGSGVFFSTRYRRAWPCLSAS
ncbi:hypothetical protein VaNZ11_008394 [Volvox africanus]|uniref:Uncharacterized protein n=1 Tax=Volvox africanus TaxID=51714 RepID=A0ABQ5S5G8_9CHLO|nr:hypothetical protein VaNZ11_008394 [Volvox africanus]